MPLLLALTACTSNHVVTRAGSPLPTRLGLDALQTDEPGESGPGVSLIPLHINDFIFGVPIRAPEIQPGSLELAALVDDNPRLHVLALPSGEGTAALNLVEDSPPHHTWGELMTPAQRRIFRAFAGDPALGTWLVIVNFVNVLKGPNPVPMVAYRWPRIEVERYASCGIPSKGIDRCTAAFYATPEMLFVGTSGGYQGR